MQPLPKGQGKGRGIRRHKEVNHPPTRPTTARLFLEVEVRMVMSSPTTTGGKDRKKWLLEEDDRITINFHQEKGSGAETKRNVITRNEKTEKRERRQWVFTLILARRAPTCRLISPFLCPELWLAFISWYISFGFTAPLFFTRNTVSGASLYLAEERNVVSCVVFLHLSPSFGFIW